MTPTPIVVAFCTFKRPDYLARLLNSLENLAKPAPTGFIIVDNDGDDPEVAALCEAFRTRTNAVVELVVEREPGISAARNAAFAAARRLGAITLAMLDDDEWPQKNWLKALIAERDASGAKVVGGPVRPVFPEGRDDLARHSRFWSVEREYLHGKPFVFCTCNFLVEMDAVAILGDRPFDPAFGITGGGDTVFFRALFDAGVPMSWSEDAWISEEIPASRASIKWLRQRRFRMGNAAVRWERDAPVYSDMSSITRTLAIMARLPIYPFLSREKSDRKLAWLLEYDKLRGRLAAQFGSVYSEYSRPSTPPGTAPDDGKACR